MMRSLPLMLVLALLVSISSCTKGDKSDDYELIISHPIANTGDQVTFSVKNVSGDVTGVRWDPGNGTVPYSTSYWVTQYTYQTPGEFTVTATLFEDNKSIALSAPISVQGTTINDTTSNNGPSIRITGIELIQASNEQADDDFYPSSSYNIASDPYFQVSYRTYLSGELIIYPRSTTKENFTATTWSLGSSVPAIPYTSDLDYVEISFYDDDTIESSADDYIGSVIVQSSAILSYAASKPTNFQLSYASTSINITVEWIN